MFVTMRNRFIEEISKMHNSVVQDLESLSKEITFTQGKIEEVDLRHVKEFEDVNKGFMEMEAFINTLIFNEKAARTAMTKQLASSIDLSTRDYTKKIDDLTTYCGDINAALESATNDLANLDTEHTNFYYEFQNYKDSNENAIKDIVIRMTMEKMMNMLETYEVNVKTLANKDKTIVGRINLQERIPSKSKAAIGDKKPKDAAEMEEMMDRKVEKVYERVRNDNWIIWKESIRLAEKEFSQGGVQKTMDFLPKVTYDRNDLKRTINTLLYEDAEQRPKPVIKVSQGKAPPPKNKGQDSGKVGKPKEETKTGGATPTPKDDKPKSREDKPQEGRDSKQGARKDSPDQRDSKQSIRGDILTPDERQRKNQ